MLNDVWLIWFDLVVDLRVGYDDSLLYELIENGGIHAVHVFIVIDVVVVDINVDILVIEFGFCGILIVVDRVFVFMAGLRIHR